MNYDVFNGDADGLCAIRQFRLAKPSVAIPITGLKRDINLMERIQPSSNDSITVADISMDRNRRGLWAALNAGAYVSWFDHHFSGESIVHQNLNAHITHCSNMCSSLIVYQYLHQQGYQTSPSWALAGAFGDGLNQAALAFAKTTSVDHQLGRKEITSLQELGVLINYNSYGETLDDLHIDPESLYLTMQEYIDPLHFIAGEPCFAGLRQGYQDDISQALKQIPYIASSSSAIYILPDAAWSRRVSGTWANYLLYKNPDRAHAVLFPLHEGGWRVSVRAPLNSWAGADTLCCQFPTGGGRRGAAGIDNLNIDLFSQFQHGFMSFAWSA